MSDSSDSSQPGAEQQLAELRARIDGVDDAILELLRTRADIVRSVGALKDTLSLPTVYDGAREQQVLARLIARGADPLSPDAVAAIFREIMAACRALQRATPVAFLGPEATFTHEAARRAFGDGTELRPEPTIDAVFDAVERGSAVRGVVPIENSTEGSVLPTLRRLIAGPLRAERAIVVPVVHQLASQATSLAHVAEVHSHPQALAQCAGWLQRTLPMARLVPTVSTAAAAESAAARADVAAIASQAAADRHGLRVLAGGIQDRADNATRFVVLGTQPATNTGHDRTLLAFALEDGAGALRRALAVFETAGINLTRIESLPDRSRAWQCSFFVELEGHESEPRVQRALDELGGFVAWVRVLGGYGV